MPPMYGDFGDGLSLLYIANLYKWYSLQSSIISKPLQSIISKPLIITIIIITRLSFY